MGQLGGFSMEKCAKVQQPDDHNTPATARNNIPIIDLAGIDGPEHETVCQAISEACETWGFFHLINHGIDQSLLKRTKDVSMEFFHSPEEEKSKIKVEVFEGWNHSKNLVEGNKLVQRDTVEHLVFYPERPNSNRYPEKPPSYRPTLLQYTKELQCLAEKLLRILSESLGLAPDALQAAALAAGSSAPLSLQSVLRSNFYGLSSDGEALPNLCHAHNDPGFITFLLADDAPGLEIHHDGRWVKVDPIPGGLIVNIADMLEVCSNGRYKSVYHKGLPCSEQERLTLAFFQMPEMDAVMRPIPSLVDESRRPLYRAFTFAEFFQAAVKRGLDGQRGLASFQV